MVFLALAVACSLAIGMIFKVAALRGVDRMALLAVNYGVAGVLAGVLVAAADEALPTVLPAGLVVLGLATGALFIGGFFLLSYATELAGMSLSLGVMRLSVIIPVAISWVVWNEVPTAGQQSGLLVACAAFALVSTPGKAALGDTPGKTAFLVLGALFLAGGVVDVLLKTFDMLFAEQVGSAVFLLFVFVTAAVLGTIRVVQQSLERQAWPSGAVYGWGVVLGLVNYGSAAFLLEAVAQLRGPVVFPLNNIAIVLGSALLGVLVWRERVTRRGAIGLVLAAVALALIGGGQV